MNILVTEIQMEETQIPKAKSNNFKIRISFTKMLDPDFYKKLLFLAQKRNVSITSLLFYLASEKLEEKLNEK